MYGNERGHEKAKMTDASAATTLAAIRRLLLGVLTFGLAGTTTDLLLIGHYEDVREQPGVGVRPQ
jgi:hypothetical protein